MKYIVLSLFVCLSYWSTAQEPIDQAIIELDRNEFDFGELHQGDKKSHAFTIRNTGNIPLIISDVHTQCGCTAVEFPEDPIMPGKSSELVILYDSSNKVGIQRKVVTIISNASEDVKIRILAQVYTE